MKLYTGMRIRAQQKIYLELKRATPGVDIVMEKIPEGGYIKPTFSLDDSDAQELFEELWRVGFRPIEDKSKYIGIEKHLEDMRQIAFKKLGVEKP